MAPFHRLTPPSYHGGLPAEYDYINDPSANGDSGAPALADDKKVGGPNAGTFFVAFGEDARSSFANRGLKALAQNTDAIDDILRRSIALTVRTSSVTSSGDTAVLITGDVFIGALGTANTQDQRNRLISILDADDNEIIDAVGNTIRASLIHDGSNNNVVGTTADGFYTNPTVTFTSAIPNGVNYRVYYGERSSLAELPPDAFTDIRIRGAQEVSGGVEKQLRDLHAPLAAQAWDDPWDASIRALARAGLNERYRRSTQVVSGSYDTPGDGAVIVRDGRAVEFSNPLTNRRLSPFSDPWPDPILADLRVSGPADLTSGEPNFTGVGGDIGLFQELNAYTSDADLSEFYRARFSGPLVLEAIPRDIRDDTLSSGTTLTKISPVDNAIINPGSVDNSNGWRTISCALGQYFRNSNGKTAVRLNLDMLEVQDDSGNPLGTYVIEDFINDTTVRVLTLTGERPALSTVRREDVRIRLLQPTVSIGGDPFMVGSDTAGHARTLLVTGMPPVSESEENNRCRPPAQFFSSVWAQSDGVDPYTSVNRKRTICLSWGGWDSSGNATVNGELLGDGGLVAYRGRQQLCTQARRITSRTVHVGNATIRWNPLVQGCHLGIRAGSTITVPSTYTINFDYPFEAYTPLEGDELVITIEILSEYNPINAAFSFPSTFVFSGNDHIISNGNAAVLTKLVCTFWSSRWLVSRTDY